MTINEADWRIKIMNKNIKISGIKKAVLEYNNWLKRDCRYVANIMIDVSDGKVWCDCFTDCNTWKEYRSKTIKSLSRYINENFNHAPTITTSLLKEYGTEMINYYIYMSRKFKDENENIITAYELYDTFKNLQLIQPDEYDYTFDDYVSFCISKNGTLTEIE